MQACLAGEKRGGVMGALGGFGIRNLEIRFYFATMNIAHPMSNFHGSSRTGSGWVETHWEAA